MTMQVDKARLDDGQSFEWKGKTYYRGPLEHRVFGSSRKISLTPFPSVCPTCGTRSLRSTEGKETVVTDEMVEAGAKALSKMYRGDSPDEPFGIMARAVLTAALTRSPE